MQRIWLGLSAATAAGIALASDLSAIEKRRLFEPTEAELRQEARGRIYIYDGKQKTDTLTPLTQ